MNDIRVNQNSPKPLSTPSTPPQKKSKIPWLVLALVVILFGSAAGVFYKQNQDTKKELAQLKSSAEIKPNDEAKETLDHLSQILVLPQNEQPIIATVVDLEKLKGQPFFVNAALLDKVIIYSKAGKAILYRPSEKRVVEIAPFSSQGQAQVNGLGTTTVGSLGK